MLVQLQLRAPKVPVQEGAGALEAPAVLVQGVHSASWCTVLCRCFAVQDTCVAGEHPRGARMSRDARGPHCHTYTVVLP